MFKEPHSDSTPKIGENGVEGDGVYEMGLS